MIAYLAWAKACSRTEDRNRRRRDKRHRSDAAAVIARTDRVKPLAHEDRQFVVRPGVVDREDPVPLKARAPQKPLDERFVDERDVSRTQFEAVNFEDRLVSKVFFVGPSARALPIRR